MIPTPKHNGKLRILVLAGGISHEREISLKSGRRVADALIEQGASVIIREPDSALLGNIKKDKPDVIWPCLHGATGEDGALRDILALTGVPFVGATAQGSRLAWDKSIAKILVEREGVQTPASITLRRVRHCGNSPDRARTPPGAVPAMPAPASGPVGPGRRARRNG